MVEVFSAGPIAATSKRFSFQRRFGVSIIVKGTFAFAANAPMPVASPEPLAAGEVHPKGDPRRSIRRAVELAPRLARADVLFVGNAYARLGVPAERLPVRLRVVRADGTPLVDKRLVVVGDRQLGPDASKEPPVLPFVSMPIEYERAFGGLGNATNPIGVGSRPAPGAKLPNVIHPDDVPPHARVEPAGMGPISTAWAARKKLVDPAVKRQLAEPSIDLGDAVDWSFFQAAPIDQQCEFLRGDEWIVLDNLHPSIPEFKTRIPAARARAQATIEGKTGMIDLDLDTLIVDASIERCAIVWRGSFFVANEAALDGARVVAVLECAGRVVESASVEDVPQQTALAATAPGPQDHAGTVALDMEASGFAGLSGVKLEGTITVDAESRPPPSLAPFKITRGASSKEPDRSPSVAAATPWSEKPLARPPLPSSPFEGTLALEESAPAKPAPPPPPAPAKAEAPAPKPEPPKPPPSKKDAPPVEISVASPASSTDEARKPVPAKSPATQPLKTDLYGKFKR